MRKSSAWICACAAVMVAAWFAFAHPAVKAAQSPPGTTEPAENPAAAPPSVTPQTAPTVSSAQSGTIVLDPAHGGADNGARGANGVNEKDLVLGLAHGIRAELLRRGFRVVMTRDGDSDPSFDDRAAVANALPDAIYVSLHVASTGPAGSARVYYYRFAAPFTFSAPSADAAVAVPSAETPPVVTAPTGGLVPWREAQRPFDDASHRLGNLLQAVLALQFSGSPGASAPASVRELRSVAEPAVAIEVSSVAVTNPAVVGAMASPLGAAIAQSAAQFRPAEGTAGEGGGVR